MSPDHPVSDQSFTERLSSMLLDRLATPTASFVELASAMDGAWPPEILAALKALQESGRISKARFEALMSADPMLSVATSSNQLREKGLYLPEPHPLNYDWRFSARTIEGLLEKISLTAGSVALLGVPSLYRSLRAAGREVNLFDINPSLCSGMTSAEFTNFVCADLQDELQFPSRFDVAVAVPPWYLEYYGSFFRRLQQLLSLGGKAFVSILPAMTRPSASTDRQMIVSGAKLLGFDLSEVFPGSIVYDTPPFEAAALLSENLILPQWRRGDLYVFTRMHDVKDSDASQHLPTGTSEVRWETFRFGACSIAVKEIPTANMDFTFAPSSEGGSAVLQSVSRRSPARLQANIWSSKNQVFKASRTDCLITFFKEYSRLRNRREALESVQSANELNSASVFELNRLLDIFEECFA